jgi:hypothetical protein
LNGARPQEDIEDLNIAKDGIAAAAATATRAAGGRVIATTGLQRQRAQQDQTGH